MMLPPNVAHASGEMTYCCPCEATSFSPPLPVRLVGGAEALSGCQKIVTGRVPPCKLVGLNLRRGKVRKHARTEARLLTKGKRGAIVRATNNTLVSAAKYSEELFSIQRIRTLDFASQTRSSHDRHHPHSQSCQRRRHHRSDRSGCPQSVEAVRAADMRVIGEQDAKIVTLEGRILPKTARIQGARRRSQSEPLDHRLSRRERMILNSDS